MGIFPEMTSVRRQLHGGSLWRLVISSEMQITELGEKLAAKLKFYIQG